MAECNSRGDSARPDAALLVARRRSTPPDTASCRSCRTPEMEADIPNTGALLDRMLSQNIDIIKYFYTGRRYKDNKTRVYPFHPSPHP